MQKNYFILAGILISFHVMAQGLTVTSGKIERFDNFKSKFVSSRTIAVWVPDGYTKNEEYAVLYMHDGQMIFDASITWNKQSWDVATIAGKLINENKTQKFIVVGIWNNGIYRHSEYFPEKIIAEIPESTKKIVVEQQLQNKPQADNYLKFITSELKPFIDSTFSTKKEQSTTFIAGSSMGGLISLYAICEYPTIFGGAACVSMHSPMVMKENISELTDSHVAAPFRNYLKTNLPDPKNHTIYFDYGDQTLDSYYKDYQEKIDTILIEKGFKEPQWITKFYPGKDHSEQSWSARLDSILLFLLKK